MILNIQEDNSINWLIHFLPFIFTLFIFWLTRLTEHLNNKFRIRDEIIRVHDYYNLWIDLIHPQIEMQVDRLQLLANDIENDKFQNFITNLIHAEKLEEISSMDRVKAFYTNLSGNSKDRVQAYFELEHSGKRIQIAHSQVNRVFEINRSAYFDILNEWDTEMYKFNDIVGRILMHGLSQEQDNRELLDLLSIIQNPIIKNGGSILFLSEELVKPTSDILTRYYQIKNKDEQFYKITDIIRRLNVCTRKYSEFKKSAILNLNFVKSELNDSFLSLNDSIMKINKFKIKALFFLK